MNVDVKNVPMISSEVAFSQFDNKDLALPSDADLEAMDTKQLIKLSVDRKVEGVKANVDTKATIIEKLKGTFVEPKAETKPAETKTETKT